MPGDDGTFPRLPRKSQACPGDPHRAELSANPREGPHRRIKAGRDKPEERSDSVPNWPAGAGVNPREISVDAPGKFISARGRPQVPHGLPTLDKIVGQAGCRESAEEYAAAFQRRGYAPAFSSDDASARSV